MWVQDKCVTMLTLLIMMAVAHTRVITGVISVEETEQHQNSSASPIKHHSRHYSEASMKVLRELNLTTLMQASRDARIGGQLLNLVRERRNKTIERLKNRRERRKNLTTVLNLGAVNNAVAGVVPSGSTGLPVGSTGVTDSSVDRQQPSLYSEDDEDEQYEDDYEDEYPDFDFSPASIFIYVLEMFGTVIGLTWGFISTLFFG